MNYVMQCTALASDEVNEQTVYICTGQPLPSDISNMIQWMLNDDFAAAYKSESFVGSLLYE